MMETRLRTQQRAIPAPSFTPALGGRVQHKCACGGSAGLSGDCAEGSNQRLNVKRQADRSAEHSFPANPGVDEVLRAPGQPLDAETRALMEPRFGHDFSEVRVHADEKAAQSAREVNSNAYTLGHDIVFAANQFAPRTPEGRQLIAHELTHVLQGVADSNTIRRSPADEAPADEPPAEGSKDFGQVAEDLLNNAVEEAEEAAEKAGKDLLNRLANLPGPEPLFQISDCPRNFCQPFANLPDAQANSYVAAPLLLAGIAKYVDPRLVPLWHTYMSGGSSQRDLSASFGKDFTKHSATKRATQYLVSKLGTYVEANQASLISGAGPKNLDFTSNLSVARIELSRPNGPDQMNFISDIPGKIAGGVSAVGEQASYKIGALPSPQDDARDAAIKATLTRNADGSLTVTPDIKFSVLDTIDLCPGDCGAQDEQLATVPLSRFEATGLFGDVPFVVEFKAPSDELTPFNIAAAALP